MSDLIARTYFELKKTKSLNFSSDLVTSTVSYAIAYANQNNLTESELDQFLKKELNDLLDMTKREASKSIA